ncbi:MAG TPA: hypothetical protein VLV18_09025 [Terriglobales bacterium]|nr:hypothetical protein [Terriglobales bacterium]
MWARYEGGLVANSAWYTLILAVSPAAFCASPDRESSQLITSDAQFHERKTLVDIDGGST